MSQVKIAALVKQINYHRDLYYNDQPEISDEAFDCLIDTLKELDPENTAITQIGAPLRTSEWPKATHKIPMGSLNKASSSEEITKWVQEYLRNQDSLFYSEKIDGLSISVVYDKGKLIQAITRGGGLEGEDITPNVLKMQGVKKQLPIEFTGSLRGEILLRKSNYEKYLKQDYENPRNAASGIARRHNGSGCEYLDVFFYQVVGNKELNSEYEQLEFIKNTLELQTPDYGHEEGDIEHKCEWIIRVWQEYQDNLRDELDYLIDGLVVRIDNLYLQASFKELHGRPYGAIAMKFPSEEGVSIVKSIQIQCGKFGRITPVVEIEPVSLAGVMISRASLHNFANIQNLELDIGAQVVISRRGDVIPYVEAVLEPTGTTFQAPTKCPVCQGQVEFQGEYLVCTSTDTCNAQIAGRIINWINTLNILEWGEALISRLIEAKLVSNIVDLYKLSIDNLASLDRMGAKSAQKCHQILWSHNPIPLDQFLGGLSIPLAAVSTFQLLIQVGYDSLDKILSMSYDEMIQIKGMGTKKSNSLFQGLKRNQHIIEGLLKMGIKIKDVKVEEKTNGKLSGLNICITGKTNTKRADLQRMIEENGGVFKSSVSKDCTHLLIHDPHSQSTKAVAARKAGITLISEDDFFAFIE